MRIKPRILLTAGVLLAACGGTTTTTTSAYVQDPATVDTLAPTYIPAELNALQCGKWLEGGRTAEGLQQMVIDNPGFDWLISRDSNQDGEPCEDEIGDSYLPTTTTAPPPPTAAPTTTTTTEPPPTTEVMDECQTAILADLGLDEDFLQVGDADLDFPRALDGVCSDVEFRVWINTLSRLTATLGVTNAECQFLNTLYLESPEGSRSEELLLDAYAECIADIPIPTTMAASDVLEDDFEAAGVVAFRLAMADHPIFGIDLEATEQLGRDICDALDAGAGLMEIGNTITSNSDVIGPEDAGAIMGAAAAGLCPEHWEWLQAQAEALGS